MKISIHQQGKQRTKRQTRLEMKEQSLGSYDTLVQLLETTIPSERDLLIVAGIASQLSRLDFFKHISAIDVENLAQHIQYRHMREHQVILREGDEGKAFYVIIRGRAAVYKLDTPPTIDVEAEDTNPGNATDADDDISESKRHSTTSEYAAKSELHGARSNWLQSNNERAATADELSLQRLHGGFLTALMDDDTFGEIAMKKDENNGGGIRKGSKHLRTATVLATGSAGCDLIVIHNEDFESFVAPHGDGATFFAWKRCRDILSIPAQARSHVEVKLLCDFVSKISFFAQLTPSLRAQLCRCAQLRTMAPNQNIFSEGESGTEFFIILDGEVLVIKNNELESVNENETGIENQGVKNQEKVVARLCKGDAFGEQALLTGEPRSATTRAHATGPIELMVIVEDDYRRSLEPLMSWTKNRFSQSSMLATNINTSLGILATKGSARTQQQISNLRYFLDHLPFFKQLPSKLIDRLCHVVSLKRASKHDVICHQGDVGEEFYVILQGSISIHIVQDEQKQNILKAKRRWDQNQGGLKSLGQTTRRRNSNIMRTQKKNTKKDHVRDTTEFSRRSKSSDKTAKAKRKTLLKQARRQSNAAAGSNTDVNTNNDGTCMDYDMNSNLSSILNIDGDETNTQTINDLLEDHGDAVATLLAGDSFGEGAIVSDKPRVATVICREDSTFMVISKIDYLAIASLGLVFDPSQCLELLGKEPKQRTVPNIERLVKFVHPIPFFQQLDLAVSRKLCSCMFLFRAKQRNIVVLQGDEVDKHGGCFYIILRGTVSVHVIDGRVHPDTTGMRLLMDNRPKDGHTHKEGYLRHLAKVEDSLDAKIKRTRKKSDIVGDSALDEVGRNADVQRLDPLAFDKPLPLHRLNDLDRVLGKCVTILHAGDSFGELGLHDHHDHDGLDHTNDKHAGHIMSPEAQKDEHKHGQHKRRVGGSVDMSASTNIGSNFGGSPPKMSKAEKQRQLALQMVGKRNASIVCREDCELLIVRRADFLNVLSSQKVHFNPSTARRVMEKPKEQRTAQDLNVLVELCESLSFFAQFPNHLISKCCQCLTLHTYMPGDLIFEQGAPGDALYIVLSGYLELDIASGTEDTAEHHDDEPMSEAHAERVKAASDEDELFFRRHLETKVLTKWKKQIQRWTKRARDNVEQAVLLGEIPKKISGSVGVNDVDQETKDQQTLEQSARHLLGHKHHNVNQDAQAENKKRPAASWSGTKVDRKSYGSAVCIFKTGEYVSPL
jgi:CRP-like cAMP-binding protein